MCVAARPQCISSNASVTTVAPNQIALVYREPEWLLVQMYIPQIGHTSTWRPGERVIGVLERGGKIEPGTAVATFVKGRYPPSGHRHAAFYEGAVRSVTGSIMGIILLDQWNPSPGRADRPLIKRRTVERRGKMRDDGTFPLISDNAEAFYVIEK